MESNKIFTNSLIGIIAKLIDAFAKFFTIPLLISFYGKSDYGLIALAISLNTYLKLMDMGMNTGAIRYFSIWFVNGEKEKVLGAARSSIVFYGCIGFINTCILLLIGLYGNFFFKLEITQGSVFKIMLFTLALSTFFNWIAYVVSQLLISYGEIKWTNYSTIVSSILSLVIAFISVYLHLDIKTYFLLYVISTLIIIPFNIYRLKVIPINNLIGMLFKPKWDYSFFKLIQKYSIAIFTMGIFQFSGDNLRPILLASFSSKGTSVLTDYRVLQTIITLVGSMGSVFLQVLLPVASRGHALNDYDKKNNLVYTGTKYITIFLSLLIFGLIINIKDLILIFVGKDFTYLTKWLIINLLLMFYMHDYSISSIVLSIGKIRALVFSSLIAATTSILLTIIFIEKYEVGSTVIGFGGFIAVQFLFNYFYYFPKIIKINGINVLKKSFFPVFLISGLLCLCIIFIEFIFIDLDIISRIFIKSSLFLFLFLITTFFLILNDMEKNWIRNFLLIKK
jgi:O-antigen/teichoic acid export membrane protein